MINHFYHIYADGQWQDPVDEHINALKEYELIDSINSFNIGMVGSETNRELVKHKLQEYDVDFSVVAEENSGWEQVTMNKLYEFSQTNEGLIFYAHTKGSHDPSQINLAWRKSMCYFNVVKWKDIPNYFQDYDVDTIGCHWCKNSFWGGTYWWAQASYVSSLGYPLNDDRWQAELWIGQGSPKVIDLNPGWPAFERFITIW
jgi:hypothetical protein